MSQRQRVSLLRKKDDERVAALRSLLPPLTNVRCAKEKCRGASAGVLQMSDANMITGLCSPGPKYALPTTFAKASIKTKHPTWGTGGSGAFKDGRLRSEEVRFHSRRHMRVFIGHYGPGPQYDVPSSIGGATGNYIASTQRLLDNCAVATGHRAVSYTHLTLPTKA